MALSRLKIFSALVAVSAILGVAALPARAAGAGSVTTWSGITPPLATPWTAQVSPTNALPDYPRPQLTTPNPRSWFGTKRPVLQKYGNEPNTFRT